MELVVGVALGVMSSFLAWLISFRVIAPSIDVSTEVGRLEPPASYGASNLYRLKVRNRRRWRRVIDVDFQCAFAFSGLYPDRPENRGAFPVPVDQLASPRLLPRSNRVAWLRIHQAVELRDRVPHDLQQRFDDGSIRLEELLSLPNAELRFFVRGNDGFSGAPRLVERILRAGCVVIGPFENDSTRIDAVNSCGREIQELLNEGRAIGDPRPSETHSTDEPTGSSPVDGIPGP